MSQDKPVTPQQSGYSHSTWLARSMSTAPLSLLRLRNIEKIYGSLRRSSSACRCKGESRHPEAGERAVLWCALQPRDPVPQVLVTTPCRLLPVSWLVMSPIGGLYSWFEVFELREGFSGLMGLRDSGAEPMETLEKWEILGKKEIRFKIHSNAQADLESAVKSSRFELIQELLQRFPNFSHINFNLESGADELRPVPLSSGMKGISVQIELLRERLLPFWRRSGDMAYRSFTAYTITRKDV